MDALLIALLTAIVNGLVTWGVVKTKLAYMDRDIRDNKEAIKDVAGAVLRTNARIDVFLGRRASDKVYQEHVSNEG